MENKTNLPSIFDAFTRLKVMVIGDVMTDSYLFGKVDRISPEAPVPVVHITNRDNRPGGAANVAINISEMGATAILCSVTGNDDGGQRFLEQLKAKNLDSKGIIQSPDRVTTVKTRVIGNNHQLLRIDEEQISPLDGKTANQFIDSCISLMDSEKPNVIIFEDYDKGVLTPLVIEQLIAAASSRSIPVTVDPKKVNFSNYKNVKLFKPNLLELKSGTNNTIEKISKEALDAIVKPFLKKQQIEMMMVTLSEAGVYIASEKESFLIPAHVRNVSDVSGAGDTVISIASLCIATGLSMQTVAALSNLAGGLVCEMIGVVPVNKETLLAEAVASKIFEPLN
ncbi:MAG: Bifunctional protein HldE [Bacteroidetes bacterium ADurb.Bin397]|nr:MAG: Bifunctional protein HldE [Bacteroidetes bacterium ADurb.Bin397]